MFSPGMNENTPLFPIAQASELSGLHPQTLRQYDRLGLVSPQRTAGKTRRYSMRDVMALREVTRLSAEGVNLEGIKRIIELEKENAELHTRVRQVEAALADEIMKRQGQRVFAAGSEGDVIPLRPGQRAGKPDQVVVWNPVWRLWSEWLAGPPDTKTQGRGK